MKGSDAKSWVTVAVMAGGVLVLWKLWDKLASAGDKASKSIADAYVRATAGPVIEVLGRVVLPNGQKIPMSAIKIVDSRNFIFEYAGKRYKLLKRRADNDYDSALAGFGMRVRR